MKKLLGLLLAVVLVLTSVSAMAEMKTINPEEERNITIQPAGENSVDDNVSPTTGRNLDEVADAAAERGFLGYAVTGWYQPLMVQIDNSNAGLNRNAPLNGSWADIVYETPLYSSGMTRISMIFSDVAPDYVGFVRSTRLTHVRIRQEWDAILCTSGYSPADVPDELKLLGVRNPEGATADDPGRVFVGDYRTNKPWKNAVARIDGYVSPTNEMYNLHETLKVVPQDYYIPVTSHAFKFSDELPEGGDDANFVYVTYGYKANGYDYGSELQYDANTKTYVRYLKKDGQLASYRENIPEGLKEFMKSFEGQGKVLTYKIEQLAPGEEITFSNVIVQFIRMNWRNSERPDPDMLGTGNAEIFMGGKHYSGKWSRDNYNSRTVFYGPDGQEISLQRGKTMIFVVDFNSNGRSVSYE